MQTRPERCRHCGTPIAEGLAVYSDHNRKFCSESCARAQLDRELGVGHHSVAAARPPSVDGSTESPMGMRAGGGATRGER